MMNDNEFEIMEPFLIFMRFCKVALCTWNFGTQLIVQYACEYESMNEYDEDDPRFEEYYACAVIIKEIKSFDSRDGFPLDELEACVNDQEHRRFEFCYHEVPQHYVPFSFDKGRITSAEFILGNP